MPQERYNYVRKEKMIEKEIERLENYKVGANKEVQSVLEILEVLH